MLSSITAIMIAHFGFCMPRMPAKRNLTRAGAASLKVMVALPV